MPSTSKYFRIIHKDTRQVVGKGTSVAEAVKDARLKLGDTPAYSLGFRLLTPGSKR